MFNLFILLVAISVASGIFISALYPTLSSCLDLVIVETPSFNKYKLKAYIIVSSSLLPIVSLQVNPPKMEFLQDITEYLQYGAVSCVLLMIFIYNHDTPAKFLREKSKNKFEKTVLSLVGLFAEICGRFMDHNKIVAEELSDSLKSYKSFEQKADERLTVVELQSVNNANSTIEMKKNISGVQLNQQILRKDIEGLSESVYSYESLGKKYDKRLIVVEEQLVNNANSTEFCKKEIQQISGKAQHAKIVEQISSKKYADEAKIRKLYEENQNLNFDCEYRTFKVFVTLQQVESKILWIRKANSKLPNYRQAVNFFDEIFEVSKSNENNHILCSDLLNYYFTFSGNDKENPVTYDHVGKARKVRKAKEAKQVAKKKDAK